MSLYRKHRPKSFDEIIGQGLTPLVLKRMAEDPPDGLLFVGSAGTGKTSAARIFAQAIDAEITELDAGVTGSVAEIRALTESLRFAGGRRVIVLDEAQSISREGWNALLKSLEEPTPGITWIVATTEPKKIPPTIQSRLIEFEFRRISISDISALVLKVAEAENFSISAPLVAAIASRAHGSARRALVLLERCVFADISSAEEFLAAEGLVDSGPHLVAAIASGDPAHTEATLDDALRTSRTPAVVSASLISTLRDLQILRAGGHLAIEGEALERRKSLAASLTPEAVFSALSVLWQFQTMLATSEDPATDLRLAVAILERHLHLGRKIF